jgi:hypothetical protein
MKEGREVEEGMKRVGHGEVRWSSRKGAPHI